MSNFKENQKKLEELANGNIGKLLLKYSWPALISMTLNALYAVVDRIFIGQGCGVDAMAGLQLAMPLMMFLGCFGPLIGVGHGALLSIKLGQNDRLTCEKIVGEVIALKVLIFFTLTPLLYLNLDTVLAWCGADKVTPGAAAAAKYYLQIVLFSHLFSHIAFGLSAQQRAEGGAIRSMLCMIVGFGVNMILDPILIFGFGMGIAGAAWATNIAMFLSCLWALQYYLRGKTIVRLRWQRIWIYPEFVMRALGIGLAPFLQQMASAAIVASLQIAFAKWMPDEVSRTSQIVSLGVFNSVLILTFMPVIGAEQGLQPIIGYNWGARDFKRVLSAIKVGFGVITVLCVFAWAIQFFEPFPTYLARMFISSDKTEIIKIASHDLQLSNCMIWCISINVLATVYFQSIGKPKTAIILSLLRQVVCLLPCIWILPYFFEDKAFAIWVSMPVSDVLCQLASIPPWINQLVFLRRVRSKESYPIKG